jgi:hypothetical protein
MDLGVGVPGGEELPGLIVHLDRWRRFRTTVRCQGPRDRPYHQDSEENQNTGMRRHGNLLDYLNAKMGHFMKIIKQITLNIW